MPRHNHIHESGVKSKKLTFVFNWIAREVDRLQARRGMLFEGSSHFDCKVPVKKIIVSLNTCKLHCKSK